MIDQIQPGSVGPVTTGANVKNQRLQGILRYWNEKRADRAMPSLRQIDPVEIPRLLPIILIADVVASGAKIRLLGTDATTAYGQEIRGRDITELDLGDFQPFWQQAFAFVLESGLVVAAAGSYRKGLELLDADVVLAPLSDDGVMTSHILGGLLIRPAPCMATAGQRAQTGILAAAAQLLRNTG